MVTKTLKVRTILQKVMTQVDIPVVGERSKETVDTEPNKGHLCQPQIVDQGIEHAVVEHVAACGCMRNASSAH